MGFLRRLLGLAGPDVDRDASHTDQVPTNVEAVRPPAPPPPTGLACPSCATLLEPPPVRDRLCPRCRQPIVVRHVDGRVALLTRASVQVFEAERRRSANEREWTVSRGRWLRLARRINASPARRAKLEVAPISAEIVLASRNLYVATADRAVKAARRERRWADLAQIRREQARTLFEEAGSPSPPPDEITNLYREGMTAALRSLQPLGRDAELVSSGCCSVCRAEGGKTFRITAEVRVARLPHVGCPAGLCGCDWWSTTIEPKRKQRRSRAAR